MSPITFPPNLQQGSRAQITCSVTSGDLPIQFSWLKDGQSLTADLNVFIYIIIYIYYIIILKTLTLWFFFFFFQIEEKRDDFYSFLVFKDVSSRHSGKYSCLASNKAAQVNETAELLVKVPPSWSNEPVDVSVLLGDSLRVHCRAAGFPTPKIEWLRGHARTSDDYRPLAELLIEDRLEVMANGTLWTDAAKPQHEGHYLCRSSNGIGSALGKVIYVSVNGTTAIWFFFFFFSRKISF